MQAIDLLLKNGYILQFDKKFCWQPQSIAIDAGRIIEIGDDEILTRKFEPKQTIKASGMLVSPGFINTHTHNAMAFYRGLADDLPLMVWLNDHIWPIENKFTDKDFVRDASLFGCGEMIKNGITTFNDQYFFGLQTAESAKKAGIRAVLGEGILDFPIAQYENSDQILKYSLMLKEKYQNDELIDASISPHSIYTCSRKTLEKAIQIAADNKMIIHTHISETQKEVDDCLKKNGKRPVEYLQEIGMLDVPVVAAHCVWLNEKEQQIFADKSVSVSLNTSSNLKLSSGFAPVKDYLLKGVNLTIGTDGVASNNNLSILEEISFTAKLHKALNNDPTLFTANEIIKAATLNAAKSLRKEKEIGSIETGKKADLILIRLEDVCVQPIYDPFSHLAYTITSEQIRDVIINGQIVMKNRKLMRIDENELIEKAKYYQDKIRKVSL